METNDRDAFNVILVRFSRTWDHEADSGVYFQALEDYTLPEIRGAFRELVTECKWMPRPVEIITRLRASRGEFETKPDTHWRQERYRCSVCRDSRFASVWHPQTLSDARKWNRGELGEDAVRWSTAAVFCSCDAGLALSAASLEGRTKSKRMRSQPITDDMSDKHVPFDCNDSESDAKAKVLVWARDYQSVELIEFARFE